MKKKLKIIVPLALLILGGGLYKMVLAKPAEVHHKVEGEVYVLPKEFLINLADGQFAKLSVGLILEPGALAAGGHGGEATKPPEGYGLLPQEPLVRDIITDVLTSGDPDALISGKGRRKLKKKILQSIHKKTDVHAEQVLFTDVAVQ
jgi:flagellar FliL protein